MNPIAALTAAVAALVMSACGGGDSSAPPPPAVYVAGWALESEFVTAPVYWTSAAPTILSRIDPACSGRAYGIALAGADVHIVGYTSQCNAQLGSPTTAAWWKNELRVDLPKPNDFNSVGSDIAIAGGSVYIAGAVSNGDGSLPAPIYWKDGAPNPLALPADADGGIAQAIAVNGEDVYVTVLFRTADAFVVGYYKNGALVRLPVTPGVSPVGDPYRITLSGGTVYITGSLLLSADPVGGFFRLVGVYWKDQALWQLSTDIQVDDVAASGFALESGHVYVAGWRRDRTTFALAPMLWTDNLASVLASGDSNVKGGVASAVTVTSGDTYVSGYALDPSVSAFGAACYWVNGARFQLRGLSYTGAPYHPLNPHVPLFTAPSPVEVPSAAAIWPSFVMGLPQVGGPHFAPLTLALPTPMANSAAWAIAVRR